ncbi:Ada metal-binding domain-containing protein [Flavitalea sp.]|nr:Ada metal-binding domain-containing protein [Flavitalea sp.]
MITHAALGTGFLASRSLFNLIRAGEICFAGNSSLKIYGTIGCKTGKRMKVANRVFFKSIKEATAAGYRPCGNCMKRQYLIWKKQT